MKSQRTMIATWLCESYLHDMHCKDSSSTGQQTNDTKYGAVEDFLISNTKHFDHGVTGSQLTDRGGIIPTRTQFNYFHLLGNYEQVISSLVNDKKYLEAITILKEGIFENVEKMIYSWSPLLIEKQADAVLDMIASKPQLKQNNLLPTWLRYTEILGRATSSSAIPSITRFMTFLKGMFESVTDIHTVRTGTAALSSFSSAYHSLVWMLCKYDDTDDEAMLLSVLKLDCDPAVDPLPLVSRLFATHSDITMGSFGSKCNPYIDYDFILRLCQTHNKRRGTVHAYLILGLYTDALEAAVTVDISLAKVSVLVYTCTTYCLLIISLCINYFL